MPEEKTISRDELRGMLFLVLIFVSVVGGRWIGNYYASYQEMTDFKVLFEVSEEELSRYIMALENDEEPSLEIGLVIANPYMENTADLVTSTPDYVKRWLIGLTVSPVVVNQPEASDVELEMLIEDILVDEEVYEYPKEKISYIQFTDRVMTLNIENLEAFKESVEEASAQYGGEVKVTFRGRVHMYLLFLDTWLPFEVVRYPIVDPPYLGYVDSEWVSYTDGAVSSMETGEGGYVLVDFSNPTRIHSLSETITCLIYREGEPDPVFSIVKNVSVPPNTDGQYTFPFSLTETGEYTYVIMSGERLLANPATGLTVR